MENLTWPEAERKFEGTEIALIPVGSIEQHGLHAPLNTDSTIAGRMARDVADEMDLICSPTLKIGVSSHHKQFWGTIWLSPEHFKDCVQDVAESLLYHGTEIVVFVNGHGGNRSALKEVAREFRSESEGFATAWTWFDSVEGKIEELFGNEAVLHSDAPETSVLWALEEGKVRKDRLEKSAEGGSDRWGRFRGGYEVTSDVIDFSENGTVGDPREADPEKGGELYREARSNLISLIEWLQDAEAEELEESPHR